jgi:hypothetical protein
MKTLQALWKNDVCPDEFKGISTWWDKADHDECLPISRQAKEYQVRHCEENIFYVPIFVRITRENDGSGVRNIVFRAYFSEGEFPMLIYCVPTDAYQRRAPHSDLVPPRFAEGVAYSSFRWTACPRNRVGSARDAGEGEAKRQQPAHLKAAAIKTIANKLVAAITAKAAEALLGVKTAVREAVEAAMRAKMAADDATEAKNAADDATEANDAADNATEANDAADIAVDAAREAKDAADTATEAKDAAGDATEALNAAKRAVEEVKVAKEVMDKVYVDGVANIAAKVAKAVEDAKAVGVVEEAKAVGVVEEA